MTSTERGEAALGLQFWFGGVKCSSSSSTNYLSAWLLSGPIYQTSVELWAAVNNEINTEHVRNAITIWNMITQVSCIKHYTHQEEEEDGGGIGLRTSRTLSFCKTHSSRCQVVPCLLTWGYIYSLSFPGIYNSKIAFPIIIKPKCPSE